MDIEEIAKIDLYLRAKNGLQHLMDVEALIIAEQDTNAVTKLKDAAYRLNDVNNPAPEEIQATWANLFSKQVRYSVNRAKQKKK
jgi:hypothetical protein